MEGAAPHGAEAQPGPSLTFSWLGEPHRDRDCLYYDSFQFCNTTYELGDHVCLTPEDPGAPLYLARITAAFEDTQQQGGDRLCIEVQWYERRANMPEHMQEGMHDREVVECLQTDTNLVGCIEGKATVIKARNYEEALELLGQEAAAGDWHFCRGVLDVDNMHFRTYEEVDADPAFCYNDGTGQVVRAAAAAAGAAHAAAGATRGIQADVELFKSSPAPQKRGQRRRGGGSGGGGRGGASWDPGEGAAAAGAHAPGGRPPKPGTQCYECGVKATPQWREGPAGPRTLCNACGMRYQRSQGKCITRPKPHGESHGGSGRSGGGGGEGYGGSGGGGAGSGKRQAHRRGRGGGGKRARGSSRAGGRPPWEGEDDDDMDYDPSFDRPGRSPGTGYAHYYGAEHYSGYGSEGGDDGDERGSSGDGGGGGAEAAAAVAAAAGGAFYGMPHMQLLGAPLPGAGGYAPLDALGALPASAADPLSASAPLLALPLGLSPPAAPAVTCAELIGLVVRASQFVPGLEPYGGMLAALPEGALTALPPEQQALLAGIKQSIEAGLSEVKAADAAVAAVGQVLEQKKAAAQRAHAAALAAAAEFRDLVADVVGGGGADGGAAAPAAAGGGGPPVAFAAPAAPGEGPGGGAAEEPGGREHHQQHAGAARPEAAEGGGAAGGGAAAAAAGAKPEGGSGAEGASPPDQGNGVEVAAAAAT